MNERRDFYRDRDFDRLISVVERQALLINGIMDEFKTLQGIVADTQDNVQRLIELHLEKPPLIDKEKEKKAREIEEKLLIRGCKARSEVLADAKRVRDNFNKQQ